MHPVIHYFRIIAWNEKISLRYNLKIAWKSQKNSIFITMKVS